MSSTSCRISVRKKRHAWWRSMAVGVWARPIWWSIFSKKSSTSSSPAVLRHRWRCSCRCSGWQRRSAAATHFRAFHQDQGCPAHRAGHDLRPDTQSPRRQYLCHHHDEWVVRIVKCNKKAKNWRQMKDYILIGIAKGVREAAMLYFGGSAGQQRVPSLLSWELRSAIAAQRKADGDRELCLSPAPKCKVFAGRRQ